VTSERDVLLLPRHIGFELPETIRIDLHDFARRESRLARYTTEIRDTYALGYVFGTFLGDGSSFLNTTGRSEIGHVAWYFGPEERVIAEKLIDCPRDCLRCSSADR